MKIGLPFGRAVVPDLLKLKAILRTRLWLVQLVLIGLRSKLRSDSGRGPRNLPQTKHHGYEMWRSGRAKMNFGGATGRK